MEQMLQSRPLNLSGTPVRRGQSSPDEERATQTQVDAIQDQLDAMATGNIDGGAAATVYLSWQNIDGGNA